MGLAHARPMYAIPLCHPPVEADAIGVQQLLYNVEEAERSYYAASMPVIMMKQDPQMTVQIAMVTINKISRYIARL